MSGETKQRISELEAEIARLKAAQPTLRDQFAMAALTGILTKESSYKYPMSNNTKYAYLFADAMMGTRNDNQN
jgi:hypothetical protein